MFVRIKSSPNSPKKSIQIVESFREGKKVRQKIVRHVGTALNDNELRAMKELAEHIKAEMEQEQQPQLFDSLTLAEMAIAASEKKQDNTPLTVDIKSLREESRIITGIHQVYGKVYEIFGFDTVINNPARKKATVKNLRHAVMGRLSNPVSKRATANMLTEQYGIDISASALYRMMDQISDDVVEKIQSRAFQVANSLFKDTIRVMFYDCTTLYFESFTEDELKENGYSKDMKFNQPQVLLSLLVTPSGLPVGYDVFPGGTYEGHTLSEAVEKIEKLYGLEDLITVADSGLFSDDNLKYLEQKGKKYIVGARIKNQSKETTAKILSKAGYTSLSEDLTVKEITVESRRLIVSHSQKRALKDSKDRQRAVDKLIDKISKSKSPKGLVSNFGYKKYIKIEGESNYSIDQEKIQRDQKWDGLLGIITNIKEELLSCEAALEQYHGLWQVEQCFRVSKSDLRIRPVYHWTPKRIKAHIAICFMALTCARYLYHITNIHQMNLSELGIRQTLNQVQISILSHMNSRSKYAIPSRKTIQAEKLYQIMGLKLSGIPYQIC